MRTKIHSNRFKRLRRLARNLTKQGTRKAAPLRSLIAQWWKLDRELDFSMRARFTPPKAERGVLANIFDHWRGDYTKGWPDPKTHRVWCIAVNAPDTFRWVYRRLKQRMLHA